MVNIKIKLTIFFVAEDGEVLNSQKKQEEADCGSDHELLMAKSRLKLKKVRKFRYNLNSVGHSSITKIKSLMILQCK